MIGTLQDEAKTLIDALVATAYWMRGGVTYSELMNLSYGQRQRIESFIDKRLETESKRLNPSY